VAGLPGAAVAAVATFLPCYLLTIIPAPWFRRHGKHPAVAAFVDGVTAGAIGAIAGAVMVLGRRSIIDLPTILIAAATLLALVTLGRRAPEPLLVAAAGSSASPSATDRQPTPRPPTRSTRPELPLHGVLPALVGLWRPPAGRRS
jgi:chromate transport protein ChrA